MAGRGRESSRALVSDTMIIHFCNNICCFIKGGLIGIYPSELTSYVSANINNMSYIIILLDPPISIALFRVP